MNKWIVRILCAVLCAVMLLSVALPAFAEEVEEEAAETFVNTVAISSLEEFLTFAENCRMDSYSVGLCVSLQADIDLSGIAFEGVPIFGGTFEGNGHTISGLSMTADGSAQGLFRYLTSTAVVQDLNVMGDVHPGGSRNQIGGIAGSNEGYIFNCTFTGTVSGGDQVGGLVGVNAVTGILENCRMNGELHGNHFVGGIAGENNGVIRNCVNQALINTTAQQNSVEISDITLDTLTNSEAVNTVTDIGGIAGASSGVIRGCENQGNVGYQHIGYNIGGIAGTQSGYIVDCKNTAQIQGRKEVGGIVGQMEPISVIEYSEDTLQILQDQLGTMSALVNQASGNAQTNASQITTQIGVLKDQAKTAQDAANTLFPDLEEPELPDLDTILAAQNTLTSTISAMPGTLNSIASATQSTVSGLSRDLQAVSAQISAMSRTINSASENLGGSITDVSDADTEDLFAGKVEGCVNYGGILGDRNVGGIAGAMAMENDLDILEDWEQYGEESLNFESEVRAVILNCENQGVVTGKKQNVGGITGWQSLGLVKNSANTGKVDAAGADYAGGISGLSAGFIRACYAKCEIDGSTYVGGIAGSASIATDCRSMVLICEATEKRGAILGSREESDKEDPVSGNFYLAVSGDIGAIDGISYAGLAEPLDLDAFLAVEELPELFHRVTIRFLYEGGTGTSISVTPGGALDESKIPAVPAKDGYVGAWEGLDDTDLTNIMFDMAFEPVYAAHDIAIQSIEIRENGLPLLLVQGDFTGKTVVTATRAEDGPALAEGETLAECWQIEISDADTVNMVRFQLPENTDGTGLVLYVRDAGGTWRETAYSVDGSYLVFAWNRDDRQIALVQTASADWIWIAAGAAAVVLVLAVVLICVRKKKKKKAAVTADQSTTE